MFDLSLSPNFCPVDAITYSFIVGSARKKNKTEKRKEQREESHAGIAVRMVLASRRIQDLFLDTKLIDIIKEQYITDESGCGKKGVNVLLACVSNKFFRLDVQ